MYHKFIDRLLAHGSSMELGVMGTKDVLEHIDELRRTSSVTIADADVISDNLHYLYRKLNIKYLRSNSISLTCEIYSAAIKKDRAMAYKYLERIIFNLPSYDPLIYEIIYNNIIGIDEATARKNDTIGGIPDLKAFAEGIINVTYVPDTYRNHCNLIISRLNKLYENRDILRIECWDLNSVYRFYSAAGLPNEISALYNLHQMCDELTSWNGGNIIYKTPVAAAMHMHYVDYTYPDPKQTISVRQLLENLISINSIYIIGGPNHSIRYRYIGDPVSGYNIIELISTSVVMGEMILDTHITELGYSWPEGYKIVINIGDKCNTPDELSEYIGKNANK